MLKFKSGKSSKILLKIIATGKENIYSKRSLQQTPEQIIGKGLSPIKKNRDHIDDDDDDDDVLSNFKALDDIFFPQGSQKENLKSAHKSNQSVDINDVKIQNNCVIS